MSDTDRRDRIINGACIDCGGQYSAECEHCQGTGREPANRRWFYLSFVDLNRPKGTRFVGACYLEAESLPQAIALSHALGINPGGEIKAWELPDDAVDAVVPLADRFRLLTREEIEAHG